MKTDKKLIGAGLLTAIAASLCCITPVLALVAGTSGLASTFSWLEPFRPYFHRFDNFGSWFCLVSKVETQKAN
jgi:mercuric ion transport protein